MHEPKVLDLLPLIAERVLRRASEMRVYADRIEREFGGDPDFEDAEGVVRELRACAESIERVSTLEGAPALIRYFKRTRAARLPRVGGQARWPA